MKNHGIGLKNGISRSDALYDRAKKVIGSGTNTFSRAPGVFPDGASPKFLSHQDGCRVWDKDTREKLDKDRFRQGLGDVVESYQIMAKRLGVI